MGAPDLTAELLALPTVRICDRGVALDAPVVIQRGVWAVTHALSHAGPGFQHDRFLLSHIPSGAAIANAASADFGSLGFTSDVAINLCRVLGERWPDFAADVPFGNGSGVELPSDLAALVIAAMRNASTSQPHPEG